MGCICATVTDEYHGWECEITGGACVFFSPNQDVCADMYGEVEHTKRWEEKHKKDNNIMEKYGNKENGENIMSEELKKAVKELENDGFYIENQFDGFTSTIPGEYELNDKNGNTLMDHLSEAQVIQFSKVKTMQL